MYVCMYVCLYVHCYFINTFISLSTGALHGSFGMDCLVVVGTTVTFVYSCVQLSLACSTGEPTNHVFFEASGMLLMFVTFGKYLEAYAKGKTVSAITNLLSMQPSHALLVVSNGSNGNSSINSPSGVGVGAGADGSCTIEGYRHLHPPTPPPTATALSVPPFSPLSPTISPTPTPTHIRGYGAIVIPSAVTGINRATHTIELKSGIPHQNTGNITYFYGVL